MSAARPQDGPYRHNDSGSLKACVPAAPTLGTCMPAYVTGVSGKNAGATVPAVAAPPGALSAGPAVSPSTPPPSFLDGLCGRRSATHSHFHGLPRLRYQAASLEALERRAGPFALKIMRNAPSFGLSLYISQRLTSGHRASNSYQCQPMGAGERERPVMTDTKTKHTPTCDWESGHEGYGPCPLPAGHSGPHTSTKTTHTPGPWWWEHDAEGSFHRLKIDASNLYQGLLEAEEALLALAHGAPLGVIKPTLKTIRAIRARVHAKAEGGAR